MLLYTHDCLLFTPTYEAQLHLHDLRRLLDDLLLNDLLLITAEVVELQPVCTSCDGQVLLPEGLYRQVSSLKFIYRFLQRCFRW